MTKAYFGLFLSLGMLLTACGGGTSSKPEEKSSNPPATSSEAPKSDASRPEASSQPASTPAASSKETGTGESAGDGATYVLVGLKGTWDINDVIASTPDESSSDIARFPDVELKTGQSFQIIAIKDGALDMDHKYGWSVFDNTGPSADTAFEEGEQDRIKVLIDETFTITLTENYKVWAGHFGTK